MKKRYRIDYEDGKCPFGYEYVNGYMTMEGKWADSHCRKLRRLKKPDPAEESERRKFFSYSAILTDYNERLYIDNIFCRPIAKRVN